MRTYVYKLYPNKDQISKLWSHANRLNKLYNYFLNQRIEKYKLGTRITKKYQQKELVDLKQNDPSLTKIHSQVVQQVPLRLHNSYNNFFRTNKIKHGKGFPRFRSCHNFFGIRYPQSGFSIHDNILKTKIYGDIKFKKHREFCGNIKQIYITTDNKFWTLHITTDYEGLKNDSKKKIGIDLGLKHLVVDNESNKIKNCTHAKYFDKKISELQSKRSNKKKKSRRYKSLSRSIQNLYGAKCRKIKDFQHKVSKDLSRKYDTIFVEDLSIRKMSESRITRLNKSIRNAKLSQFTSYLSYKINRVILVNPRNTSKICNRCGRKHDIKLSQRTILCECGNKYDRDENAAKNVYCLGQAILDLGIQDQECAQELTLEEALTFR